MTHTTVVAGLTLATLTLASPALAAGGPSTEQVALADGTGQQHAAPSDVSGAGQVISRDGRYVVFSTPAPLVASDTNGLDDVYRRDTVLGRTELVSQRNGRPGNDYSFDPTVSADGRRIAYTTMATNLTGDRDRNGHVQDVVVTRMGGSTVRVSRSTAGFQREHDSYTAVISGNGRVVAFTSTASFDVRDDDRQREDVYAHRLRTGHTIQVSLRPDGRDVPGHVAVGDISDDGRLVTFGDSKRLWVRNLPERATARFWQEPASTPCQPHGDGTAGRPMLSGDGRYVAFSSCATTLPGEDGQHPDVYRVDLVNREIVRAHPAGDGDSYLPSLSYDGAYVGFGSDAGNLVAGDVEGQPDAFVAEVATGEVVRVSQAPDGTGGNSWNATLGVVVSDDGRSVAYSSYADNLVPGDESNFREVFFWRR